MAVTALIGRKVGMTSVFDAKGAMVGVTVIEVPANRVVGLRTTERDGYEAVVLGCGERRASRTSKPQLGAMNKVGIDAQPQFVREVRGSADGLEIGAEVSVGDVFTTESLVDVVGTSQGKGFAGSHKRHNFGLGPASHGSKNYREPGSTGHSTYPGRVFKGKRMPGQMGNKRRTERNLKVVAVDAEKGRVLVKGSVPGCDSGMVIIRHAIAKKGYTPA